MCIRVRRSAISDDNDSKQNEENMKASRAIIKYDALLGGVYFRLRATRTLADSEPKLYSCGGRGGFDIEKIFFKNTIFQMAVRNWQLRSTAVQDLKV